MIYLLLILIVFFVLGIFLRKFFPKLCAICWAVTMTWLLGFGYITLFKANTLEINIVALGIIMGGSAVGSMYFIFSHKAKNWQMFKFPYLITLFTLVYIMISKDSSQYMIALIISLWIVFYLIYFFRKKQSIKWFKKIVECCKNW